MKIGVKKVRCPKCERLVHTTEQVTAGIIQLSCVRCKQPLWVWDGIKWRPLRGE